MLSPTTYAMITCCHQQHTLWSYAVITNICYDHYHFELLRNLSSRAFKSWFLNRFKWKSIHVGVARRTRLAELCWCIVVTWPNQRSSDLSIRRNGSTFWALRISQLCTFSRSVTPWTPTGNPPYTFEQSSGSNRHTTCWNSLQKPTVFPACCVVEPGYHRSTPHPPIDMTSSSNGSYNRVNCLGQFEQFEFFQLFQNRLDSKLELISFPKIALELPNSRKLEIKLNSGLELHFITLSEMQVQIAQNRNFLGWSCECQTFLRQTGAYESSRWLKISSDVVNAVIYCSSHYLTWVCGCLKWC